MPSSESTFSAAKFELALEATDFFTLLSSSPSAASSIGLF